MCHATRYTVQERASHAIRHNLNIAFFSFLIVSSFFFAAHTQWQVENVVKSDKINSMGKRRVKRGGSRS